MNKNSKQWAIIGQVSMVVALALPIVFMPITESRANLLDDALSDMSSGYSNSWSGSTVNRHFYSGPSYRASFSQGHYSMVNITPPHVEAGCHGIDAHFGGIDFISGDQIREMLQEVAQAATGTLIMMAFHQLCPICQSAIEWAQTASRWASKFNVDTCQVGSQIAKTTFDSGMNYMCSSLEADSGGAETYEQASKGMCSGYPDVVEETESHALDLAMDMGEMAQVIGNSSWLALERAGFVDHSDAHSLFFSELLLSVIGTKVYGHEVPSMLTVDNVFDIYLCGANQYTWEAPSMYADITEAVDAFCDGRVESGLEKYVCTSGYSDELGDPSNPHEFCEGTNGYSLSTETIQGSTASGVSVTGGLLHGITDDLIIAVDRVANDATIPPEVIRTINMSPFPLYRVINIAAVYPDQAIGLIAQYGQVIAMLIATEYIESSFRAGMQSLSDSTGTRMDRKFFEYIREARSETKLMQSERFKELDTLYTMQQGLMSQVRQINATILRNLRSQGLDGIQFK